jgi:hypothetical protein
LNVEDGALVPCNVNEEQVQTNIEVGETFSVNLVTIEVNLQKTIDVALTLPKMGVWSPPRLPKTQKTIARVKTPRIEVFFIPLERS